MDFQYQQPEDPIEQIITKMADRVSKERPLRDIQGKLIKHRAMIRAISDNMSPERFEFEAFVNKVLTRAEVLKRYRVLKGLDTAGRVLSPALAIPSAGLTGFDLANTGMNYAAENMGIPQTLGILENQRQDLMNMQRRQALLTQGARQ